MKAFPQNWEEPPDESGMDLRDYFAAKAMQGIVSDPEFIGGDNYSKSVSELSYEIADAMMEVRNEG